MRKLEEELAALNSEKVTANLKLLRAQRDHADLDEAVAAAESSDSSDAASAPLSIDSSSFAAAPRVPLAPPLASPSPAAVPGSFNPALSIGAGGDKENVAGPQVCVPLHCRAC